MIKTTIPNELVSLTMRDKIVVENIRREMMGRGYNILKLSKTQILSLVKLCSPVVVTDSRMIELVAVAQVKAIKIMTKTHATCNQCKQQTIFIKDITNIEGEGVAGGELNCSNCGDMYRSEVSGLTDKDKLEIMSDKRMI